MSLSFRTFQDFARNPFFLLVPCQDPHRRRLIATLPVAKVRALPFSLLGLFVAEGVHISRSLVPPLAPALVNTVDNNSGGLAPYPPPPPCLLSQVWKFCSATLTRTWFFHFVFPTFPYIIYGTSPRSRLTSPSPPPFFILLFFYQKLSDGAEKSSPHPSSFLSHCLFPKPLFSQLSPLASAVLSSLSRGGFRLPSCLRCKRAPHDIFPARVLFVLFCSCPIPSADRLAPPPLLVPLDAPRRRCPPRPSPNMAPRLFCFRPSFACPYSGPI